MSNTNTTGVKISAERMAKVDGMLAASTELADALRSIDRMLSRQHNQVENMTCPECRSVAIARVALRSWERVAASGETMETKEN